MSVALPELLRLRPHPTPKTPLLRLLARGEVTSPGQSDPLRGTLQLDPQVPDSLGMIPEACRRGGCGYQRHRNPTELNCPWRYRQHTLW